MSDAGQSPADPGQTLAELQARLAALEAENHALRSQAADHSFAEELRRALHTAGAAATISAPVSHGRLLEMIVETAAHVLRAQAASLFLIDQEAGELVFEVALGEKADEVRKFRVPLGRGFAGLVAVTGQPMSVSDVSKDPRWAGEIGKQVQYVPKSMLVMPLRYDEDVIGVIQLLDKDGGATFTPADMETLGRFAEQAAVAIEQSRISRNLGTIFVKVIESLREGEVSVTVEQTTDFLDRMETSLGYREALNLARQVQQIAGQGEAERRLAGTVLASVAEYINSRPKLDFSF